MNINTGKNKNKNLPLFEGDQSVPVQENSQEMKNQDSIETVFSVVSKQFQFDGGVMMAAMSIDTGTKFGLKWHAQNTKDFSEFADSVSEFVLATNVTLTDNDLANLEKEYSKYSKV